MARATRHAAPAGCRLEPARSVDTQLAASWTKVASGDTSGASRDHAATLAEAGKLAGRLQPPAGGAAAGSARGGRAAGHHAADALARDGELIRRLKLAAGGVPGQGRGGHSGEHDGACSGEPEGEVADVSAELKSAVSLRAVALHARLRSRSSAGPLSIKVCMGPRVGVESDGTLTSRFRKVTRLAWSA